MRLQKNMFPDNPAAIRQSALEPRRRLQIRMAQQGDISARNALIRENMGMITRVAFRFHRSCSVLELDDLKQMGCLGLIKAIEKFDLSRRVKGHLINFSTYAVLWIAHEMRRGIEKQARVIRLPNNILNLIMQESRKIREDRQADMGKRPARILPGGLGRLPRQGLSLDTLSEEGEALENLVPSHLKNKDDPALVVSDNHKKMWLASLVATLCDRDRRILELRSGFPHGNDPMSSGAVADLLGITRERVRQIERRAGKKLRDLAGETERMGEESLARFTILETGKSFLIRQEEER